MFSIERHTTILNLSIGYVVIFGLYLLNPWDEMFNAIPSLYEPMRSLNSSESFWGAIFIGAGVAAKIIDRTQIASWASFFMATVFILVAALFFMGDPQRPAGGLFLLLSIFNLIQWRSVKWNQTQ